MDNPLTNSTRVRFKRVRDGRKVLGLLLTRLRHLRNRSPESPASWRSPSERQPTHVSYLRCIRAAE